MNRVRLAAVALLCIATGCAGSFSARRERAAQGGLCTLAGLPEGLCKHCHCLMPAQRGRETMCTVCRCGRQAFECVQHS